MKSITQERVRPPGVQPLLFLSLCLTLSPNTLLQEDGFWLGSGGHYRPESDSQPNFPGLVCLPRSGPCHLNFSSGVAFLLYESPVGTSKPGREAAHLPVAAASQLAAPILSVSMQSHRHTTVCDMYREFTTFKELSQ